MVFPEASKDYDGYYTLVPRQHRYDRHSPGGEAVYRLARRLGLTFDEAVMKMQSDCNRRVRALVAEDRRLRKARRNAKRRKSNSPRTVRVHVKTVTRLYGSNRDGVRDLVRETVSFEHADLQECDYRAFPLPFALSLHRAKGDGLASYQQEVRHV